MKDFYWFLQYQYKLNRERKENKEVKVSLREVVIQKRTKTKSPMKNNLKKKDRKKERKEIEIKEKEKETDKQTYKQRDK